jgi:hypothetical protein
MPTYHLAAWDGRGDDVRGSSERVPIKYPHDVWAYLCPHCQDVFRFDRIALKRPVWWPFRARVQCSSCGHAFHEREAIAQPYRGHLPPPALPPRSADYVGQIFVGVAVAVLTTVILTILGLRVP